MKKKEYLKMMEEHSSNNTINLFQKVHVTAKRAKSLYELDEPSKASLKHKPTFQAILETNEGKIRVVSKSAEETETTNEDE
ncbi:uncharacterized protein METZ01_LOCUS186440 [marine metagenome]|uniref:DNA-directed RNA polymerase n=1 Tax=marine metagenome TaxID=408172 RepID=A0A382D501_9ZZZZ